MIKNIQKSKFFVLCSMLFCSLVVSVFLFGIYSKAASFPSENDINEMLQVEYGSYVYNSSCYNSYYEAVGVLNDKNNYVYFFRYWQNLANNNYYTGWYYTLKSGITYSNGSISIPKNHALYGFRSDGENQYNSGSSGVLEFSNVIYFDSYDDFCDYFVSIDWNNPFYSANIVAPDMSVTYRELSSTPVVDVPLNISVNSYPSLQNEYYVQLFGLVNYDENYYVQNTREGIVFNGMDLQKYTAYVDIVTPQELLKPSDLSFDMLHLRFTDGWYNNFPSDNLFSFTFQDGIPGPLQTSAISKFNNFRKNATFADNTVYVYARYFVVDNENNFVVGPWRIWKSYNPNEFTTEVPNFYLPYAVVPGTSGTNNSVVPVSTSSPEPSVIDNPVQTNPSVNITVTQNVPNYPDYPTIASYNKDNLLVDTMNQLTSIQGFFGEFGSFLVTAFAFMPAWIWAIIGVGFSLSIVVMFLKIL